MTAKIVDGWIVVPYSGRDMSKVFISVGGQWFPAFLDWVDGERVAQIRVPESSGRHLNVKLMVDDVVTSVGRLSQ